MLTRSFKAKMNIALASGEIEIISPFYVPDNFSWMCLVSIQTLEACRNDELDLYNAQFDRDTLTWATHILSSRRNGPLTDEQWSNVPVDLSLTRSGTVDEESSLYSDYNIADILSPRSPVTSPQRSSISSPWRILEPPPPISPKISTAGITTNWNQVLASSA